MKRHESLAPLSREHHLALILAQLCKKDAPVYKDLPTTVAGKAKYALDFFNADLSNHFKKEEKLFREVRMFHPLIAGLTDEIIVEHNVLTELFISLEKPVDTEAVLHQLGSELEKHIRKEERELFPLIEKYCPENILAKIQDLIS